MPQVPPLNRGATLAGFHREQIAAFLTTKLTDQQLRLIGEITTLWNSVQSRLQYFVWITADWRGGIGALVTADLQAAALVVLARNIVDNRIKNDYAKQCADATIDLFDELRAIRNKIVHGLPVTGIDGTVQEFSDSTAKRGAGLKITTRQATETELSNLLDDMALLAVAIEGLILQHAVLDFSQRLQITHELLREQLDNALLTPISHVQDCRNRLHLQLSSTGKPQPPPQS
ncbi:MAG: hypothetical protein ABSD08_15285 [Xanthobacteraceae bacterium]|jgi:hypothetical protein